MIKFSSSQMAAIEKGKAARKSLLRVIDRAVNLRGDEEFRHTYISSTPGLGKTHNITQALKKSGKPYVVISGDTTDFAFGINLMMAHFRKPKGEMMFIVFDDCDKFFTTQERMNTLKNMTNNQVQIYERNVAILPHLLSDIQHQILQEHYSIPDSIGFRVPCDEFVFIFASNDALPTDDERDAIRAKSGIGSKSSKYQSLSALRSRFRTKDFTLDKETEWGIICDACLNDGALKRISEEQKIILLDWMFYNWDNLNHRSIRTAIHMEQEMIDEPENYRDDWESDFLK